ncbi:MAG: hypothetical protein MJ153_09185 [Clostridia bacterium]|nr:hypothetical protein [Clostridia bacterium]
MKFKEAVKAVDEHQVWTNKFVGNTIKYEKNVEAVWEIKRRNNLTKKEVAEGKQKDTETPMGTIRFADPDAYNVINAELKFDTDLDVDEYKEILNGVLEEITDWDSAVMVRVDADSINLNQEEALWKLEFIGDPLDRKYLIRQFETSEYSSSLMMMGMTLGIAIGLAMNHMVNGMCYGMLIGTVIGCVIDAKNNAKREELWERRIKSVTDSRK